MNFMLPCFQRLVVRLVPPIPGLERQEVRNCHKTLLILSLFLLIMCIGRSWIDCEFLLFSSLWSGRRHCLNFARNTKHCFVRILELVNIFRHIPPCFEGASFLDQGLLMWSSLEFRRARTTLMRRTILDNTSRWPRDGPFLSRILIWCPVLLENLMVCFDPNFSGSRGIYFSRIRILRCTTQLYRLIHYRNWSFRSTFLRLLVGLSFLPLHVDNDICRQKRNLFQICNSDTREGARIHMTDFHRIWIGMEFHSCLSSFPFFIAWSLWVCVPRRQSVLPLHGMREKTIALCVSDFCPCFFWRVGHGETTWVSFGTLSMCLPLKTLLHFPLNAGFVSVMTLCNWSSFHNIVSDSEVSISHHLINVEFCVQRLDRTKPTQSEAEQNSVILTCTLLPGSPVKASHSLLTVHGPIWHRNLGHRHSVNLKRPNLWVLVLLHERNLSSS